MIGPLLNYKRFDLVTTNKQERPGLRLEPFDLKMRTRLSEGTRFGHNRPADDMEGNGKFDF